MGVKVSENLLNNFLDLAEYDDAKRQKAVIGVVNAFGENEEYCMNRLISGLSSTRAAARLGFSCALTLILSSSSDQWTVEKLFAMIDSRLDIKKIASSLPLAIGQHLAYTSMINSKKYEPAVKELVLRELVLLKSHQALGMAVCDSIARLSLSLNNKTFAKLVWPQLKSFAAEPLNAVAPEWMYFNMLCAPNFYSVMGNDVSYIDRKTGFSIDGIESDSFQSVLKRCRLNDAVVLGTKLLAFAQTAEKFNSVYEKIIWPWLDHGSVQKALERMLRFVNTLFSTLELKPAELYSIGCLFPQVMSIISPVFVQRLRLSKGREHIALLPLVENILKGLSKCMDSGNWTEDALILLERLSAFEGGSFGSLFSSNADVIGKAISVLDSKGIESYIDMVMKSKNASLRRIGNMFGGWPPLIQEKILSKLLLLEPRTEEVHYTFCDCIASSFVTKVRAGKSVKCIFAKSNEELLKKVLLSVNKEMVLPEMNNETLFAMYVVLQLWSVSAVSKQEKTDYSRDADELVEFDKTICSNDGETEYSILIDLMLSILSRAKRFHRAVVHYAFAKLVPKFKIDNVVHIFETINVPDDELLKMEDDDSDDIDEDAMSLGESGGSDDDEGENDMDGVESGSESDLDGEADPNLVEDLKEVLASAEANYDGQHEATESISSDFSDETMFRLDDGLAAVFRQQKKHSLKNDAERVLQSLEFRLKCFDLLLIIASHEDADGLTLDMLLPLLETSCDALKRKGSGPLCKKSEDLVQIIIKNKKSALTEKKALKLFKKLIPASAKIVNPTLKSEVGKISSFLFSAVGKLEGVSSSKLVKKLEKSLQSYMTQDGTEILCDVVLAPLQTYPTVFVDVFMETLVAYAFDSSLRIFRRTEALSCAVTFIRKDTVCAKGSEAFWKGITKKIGKYVSEYISHLTVEEVKPRFLAFVVRLLSAFVGVCSVEDQKILLDLIGENLTFLENNVESWDLDGKRKQQINSNFRKICGRNAASAIKGVHKLLIKASEGR
uniref:DUF2428 domain-containing protein n=1 Tax=Syphacia muris TaxID=451379 RepID=A0A0N5ADE6_9BILA